MPDGMWYDVALAALIAGCLVAGPIAERMLERRERDRIRQDAWRTCRAEALLFQLADEEAHPVEPIYLSDRDGVPYPVYEIRDGAEVTTPIWPDHYNLVALGRDEHRKEHQRR